MEWISIKDRLPDENGVYLVHTNYGDMTFAAYQDDWEIWPSGFVLASNTLGSPRGYLTHWMPLPEPPKQTRQYSYTTSGILCDSGYVIYDLDGKRIEPWDLINALNSPLPDGLALLIGLGIIKEEDDD